MITNNISVLKEILNYFIQDRKEENDKLQNNINKINEIDTFIQSVEEGEEIDFKVFSPRRLDHLYKERIEGLKLEKKDIEKENHYHYEKIIKLDQQIGYVELLMKDNEGSSYYEDCIFKENNQDNYKHLMVLDIQEKERQRIARELHDSSLQNLTHLVHNIELGSMFIDQDPIRAKLELATCIKNLKGTINEIRETVFNLRPMSFDDLGFKQCIENFIDNMRQQYNNCEIESDVKELKLDKFTEQEKENANLLMVTIFRIIQEAVINSLKHSNAEKILLDITQKNKKCYINISDNGKGFTVESVMKNKHFGLSIMKERINLLNGKIKIDSKLNQGTNIEIIVPLI